MAGAGTRVIGEARATDDGTVVWASDDDAEEMEYRYTKRSVHDVRPRRKPSAPPARRSRSTGVAHLVTYDHRSGEPCVAR